MQRIDRSCLVALVLLCSLSSSVPTAQGLAQAGSVQCGSNCTVINGCGSDPSSPPYFLQALQNESIQEIHLNCSRYQLHPNVWSVYGPGNLFTLRRNLTITSAYEPLGILDFQMLERKVLLDEGVTITFQDIALQNIRKLGGFGLDFFVGNAGSQIVLRDVVRIKLACQIPKDVLKSARTYARVSPVFPENQVMLLPEFCFTAALQYNQVMQHCYRDALHFQDFSLISATNDPDSGSQFPGYVLYQQNTTRVCESTITPQCLAEQDGDEGLCLAILVTEALSGGRGGFVWSPGAIAGVTIAGAAVLLAAALCTYYRHHILLWCVRLDGKSLQDLEAGSSLQMHEDDLLGKEPSLEEDNGQENIGRRAISQQVTLGVLLGAGSFGRVYKGRWHSSDVAVKIMSCTRAELAKVLKEAEVMMQLNHRNIVRAFHASVWNPAEQARALQAREARGGSTARPSKKAPQNRFSSRLSAAIGSTLQQQQRTSTVGSSSLASAQHLDGSSDNHHMVDVNSTTTSAHSLLVAASPAATPSGGSSAAAVLPKVPASGQRGSREFIIPTVVLPQRIGEQAERAAAPALSASAAHSLHDTTHLLQQQHGAAAAGQQQAAASSPYAVNGVAAASSSHSSSGRLAADGNGMLAAAGGAGSNAAANAREQQQHVGSSDAFGSSRASAVAEGRESNSPEATPAGASAAAQPAAAAAAEAAGSQQYLHGNFGKAGSINSTPVRGSDGTSAAAGGSGSFIASAAVTSGATVASGSNTGHNSEQQQADAAGSSGKSSGKRSKRQEREAKHVSYELVTEPAAAATATTSTQPEDEAEEGQRHEVQVWLVLELCAGGTLKDAVSNGRLRLDDNIGLVKLLSRLLETASGMAYLHSKGVMHGDLKAGNVLLQNIHGSFDQVAKISDFGLSATLLDGATHRSTASMGTITHMAPEVLRSGHLSPAADVYSFAIMMWEVFSNRQAYQGLHYGAVVERVVIQKQRPPIPDDMPDEYSLLMSSCWDAEPNNRPSFSQIATCLELMIDNLVNETGRLGDFSDSMVPTGAAAGAEGPAASVDGSTDQAAGVVSDGSAPPGGTGGSTAGSDASGWRQQRLLQQQQQRVAYPVQALQLGVAAGSASTSSHSGQHVVGMATPTQQQQQQHMQLGSPAGQGFRSPAGRPSGAAAAATGAAGHATPHSTHSTGSQAVASGSNVLDAQHYIQDL